MNLNNIKTKYNVGKNGITENLILEIIEFVKKNKVVKIKISCFKSREDLQKIILEISKKTELKILQKRGFTFCLGNNF